MSTLALLAVGVVMVHSALATVGDVGPWYTRSGVRHVLFAVVAAILVFFAWRFNYRRLLAGKRLPLLPVVLLGAAMLCGPLVFVPGLGKSVGGCHRWIGVMCGQVFIGFQPSELIKLSLVVFLAAWFSRPATDVRSFKRTFLPAVALVGACIGLVITEDFGTAVVIALAAGATMLLAGVRWYCLAGLAVSAAAAFCGLLTAMPSKLLRFRAMADPWSADNACAYQLRQSLTASAAGGWTGKGTGLGMMKLGFLPEDSTDFIFAILCEEWGFVGAAGLMLLIAVWMLFALASARRAADGFGQLLAGSLGFLVALQAVMHIAVNLGWLPPTGVSLPFVSAGGSSLVLMACATALIVSVSARRTQKSVTCNSAAPAVGDPGLSQL